jgi:hypothetical protein
MKLNSQVKEQYQFKIPNVSAGLENLGNNLGINTAWRRCDITHSAKESLDIYELKQHKQLFCKEFSTRLDQRKKPKLK